MGCGETSSADGSTARLWRTCRRYNSFAKTLQASGVSVFAVDLRGHGNSQGKRGHVGEFGDYNLDVDALLEMIECRNHETPLAMFGHSMGALLACHWLLKHPSRQSSSLVLSSPFLALANKRSSALLALIGLLAKLVPAFPLPTGLRGCDVTNNTEVAQRYDDDPLNNPRTTARWVVEALEAAEYVLKRCQSIGSSDTAHVLGKRSSCGL